MADRPTRAGLIHATQHANFSPPMLYPELYKTLESVRWDMEKDIP